MTKSFCVNYSSNLNQFLEQLSLNSRNSDDFEILIINDVSSIHNAIKLLVESTFKQQIVNKSTLYGIIFKVNEKICETQDVHPQIYDFVTKDKILISFQSTIGQRESKTYWKVAESEKFNTIYIDDDERGDTAAIVYEFLVEEIKEGRIGIIEKFQFKNKFRLQEIGDDSGRNLLVLATTNIQPNAVNELLKHDFDPDDVIDIAWNLLEPNADNIEKKNQIHEIILILLKANSRFPDNFDYKKASKQVKRFVDKCESLHADVDDDDFEGLKAKIDSEPNLVHFYDRNNESLLAYSLWNGKYKILELLDRQILTGPHEDLDEVYENMKTVEKRKLRDVHKTNAKEFPETHILILRSRSRICNNDKKCHKKWIYIDEAYETLNSNSYCRKIMKLAAKFKKLKIYFDLKHDSTYYMDPATSYGSKGIIYEGGSIFIGAKNMEDDQKKFAVFGVLAHELCHLAVYLGFMNRNFDPFPTGGSELKRRFVDRVMIQCRELKELEGIIRNVFISYSEDVQDSEMIVTVPQMMMHYIQNEGKIEELEGIFDELFKYSREVIEPELDRALKMLEIIENNTKSIRFDSLTEPMKAKILHSTVDFQGEETSFNEMIGHDNEILNHLKSEDIKDILLNNKKIQIDTKSKEIQKSQIIERFYLDSGFNNHLMFPYELSNLRHEVSTYPSVQSQIEKYKYNFKIIHKCYASKVNVIENHAGIGKTTCFLDLINRFKKLNSNLWVSFITIKNYEKLFEEIDEKIENFDDAVKIVSKLVKTQSKLDQKIFEKLLSEEKVIFLLDGIDEVSNKAAENLIDILELFTRKENKNRFWVSTRPNCCPKLNRKCWWLSIFRLTPLTDEEQLCYMKVILVNNNIKDDSAQNLIIQRIKTHFDDLKERGEEVHNLLMIQMIIELYIHKSIVFDPENRYQMYQEMIEMQKFKLGDKVPTTERDRDVRFSVWDVHRVLAIKLIFKFDFKANLPIMKIWEKCKHNWTSEMIQRYGFVTVNLENEVGTVKFIHRTYAEFFVAQYFVEVIFMDGIDKCVVQDELKMVVILFTQLFGKSVEDSFQRATKRRYKSKENKYKVVNDFLYSFISKNKNDVIKKLKIFFEVVEQKIPKHFSGSHLEYIVHIARLIRNNSEILKKLWKEDEVNFFDQVLFNDEINAKYGLDSLEEQFGSNWNGIFNKKGNQILTDDDLEIFKCEEQDEESWKVDRNLLKLCDLIDKNFEIEDKKKIYKNFNFVGYGEKVQIEIITKIHNSKVDKNVFFQKFMLEINFREIKAGSQKHIYELIEADFNNDHELLKELLFNKKRSHLNEIVWKNVKVENFIQAKNLYLKYKRSYEDFQNYLLSDALHYSFMQPYCSLFYSESKSLITEVFGTNKAKLQDEIEKIIKKDIYKNSRFSKETSENFVDYICYAYSNDKTKALKFLENSHYLDFRG